MKSFKKLVSLGLLLGSLSFAQSSFATMADRAGELGLGAMVGSTTSVTGKFWNNSNDAIDARVGGLTQDTWNVQASYLWHFPGILGASNKFTSELLPYVGAGAGLGFNRTIQSTHSSVDYFARLPLGLTWIPNDTPLDVFVEVAPSLDLGPNYLSYVEAGLGARYYF